MSPTARAILRLQLAVQLYDPANVSGEAPRGVAAEEQAEVERSLALADRFLNAPDNTVEPVAQPSIFALKLWLHLASSHGAIHDPPFSPEAVAELNRIHHDDHHGPGTMRGHDEADLGFDHLEALRRLVEDKGFRVERDE